MKRREFIRLIGGVATWPLIVRAGTPSATVNVLYCGASTYRLDSAFLAGLGELGFVHAQTVTIVYRFVERRYKQMRTLAAELVVHKVDAIVGFAGQGGLAAKAATSTTPIVFVTGGHPGQLGLVASLT